jgi:tRNA(Ile)-lysidine synthase
VEQGLAGELIAPRRLFARNDAETRRAIGALALCAAGTTRPPAAAALRRILDRLAAGADFAASLAGARIEAAGGAVCFAREAGEGRRRGIAPAPLPIGETVFDGRFVIDCTASGHRIAFLRGLAARLPGDERRRLAAIPAAARGAAPAVISPSGAISCPILAEKSAVAARPLPLLRLSAALGGVADEAALWRVAKLTAGS